MKTLAIAAVCLSLFAGCSKDKEAPQAEASSTEVSQSANPPSKAVVTLTPAALARIREVQQRDGRAYMRVSVVQGGPTGYMYDMRMDDKFDPKADYLNETDSVKVVVDMRSSLFLNGTTIDWQTTSDGRQGFKFDNPNTVSAAPSDARR